MLSIDVSTGRVTSQELLCVHVCKISFLLFLVCGMFIAGFVTPYWVSYTFGTTDFYMGIWMVSFLIMSIATEEAII